jgi:energy-coupling factor transport system substrate-specific component
MYLSKTAAAFLPNIHPLALFIAAFTLHYRTRALIPIYVYIMIDGVMSGFSMWWLPYLYIWLPLWGMFMTAAVLGNKLPRGAKVPVYSLLCALHGLSFGLLYLPAQAVMFGLSRKTAIAWWIAGLPFDVTHAVGNAATGLLILPLCALLRRLDKGYK